LTYETAPKTMHGACLSGDLSDFNVSQKYEFIEENEKNPPNPLYKGGIMAMLYIVEGS